MLRLQSRYFFWPLHQSRSSSNLQTLLLMSIEGARNNSEMLTICFVKLISILLNYKVKDNIFRGKATNKLYLFEKKKEKPVDIMLSKA